MTEFLKGMSISVGIGAGAGGLAYLLFLVLSNVPEPVLKGLQLVGGIAQVHEGVNNISSALS